MAVAALCATAAACSDIPGGPTNALSDGRTQVLLTDAPFPYNEISEVNVYVARIDVSASSDTTGSAQDWITVATPQRTFNLLDLQGGTTALLGEADLPAAQYAAVRMVINTSRSSIVRNTGALANVQWPVSDEPTLHALVEQPLAVGSGGARIVIDFDVGRSFIQLESQPTQFVFIPVIRAVNGAATGEIRGSVTIDVPLLALWSLENLPIEVYREDNLSGGPVGWLAATGRTNAQGQYLIPYLLAGDYRIIAYVPGYNYLGSGHVSVAAGGIATMNLVIGSDSTGGGGGGGGPDTTGIDTTTTPGQPIGPVTAVVMSPTAQTVHVGDSISILATPVNAAGQVLTGRTATWAVSDSTVLTTTWSNAGWILFRAQKAGDVNVVATIEGVSATARVVVQP